MSVICKMQCHDNSGVADPDKTTTARIRMGAVWEGTTEAQQQSENAIFGKWSPSGAIDLSIMNPPAAAFFKPGKKYYCTFTEAPD